MIICGLDVHKSLIWVHIKDAKGNDVYSTTVQRNPEGLQGLQRLCQHHQVSKVIMESTSTYWLPVYRSLIEVVDECCVVNAYQLKVLGKHKTDERDAELLANWGLLNVLSSSFIPKLEVHQLRQLVRTRVNIQNQKTTVISQLKTMLEGSCSGITEALKNLNLLYPRLFLNNWGVTDLNFDEWVEQIKDGRTRKALDKKKKILGYWWDHQLDKVQMYLLKHHMKRFDFAVIELDGIEELIDETVVGTSVEEGIKYISSIPGIGFLTAVTIAAEFGSEHRFQNGREAASSVGLSPKLKGSGGKTYSGRITKHGPKSVRRAVYIACKSVIRFSPVHKNFFEQVKARRGGKKALIALCRKLVILSWTLWFKKELFKTAAAA